MAVDLSNVLKLHLFIFKTSMKTGVRLQGPHMSMAVQKTETKTKDNNYEEQFPFYLWIDTFLCKTNVLSNYVDKIGKLFQTSV